MISVLNRLSFRLLFDVNWSMIEYCCEIQSLLVSACAAPPTKVLSPEFWSGEFWSGGPKFSVENWSGRTDFFGKNGPPLENWSE